MSQLTTTTEWQDTDFLRFYMIGADRKTRWRFGGAGSPVRLNTPPTGLNGAPLSHDYQQLVGMDGALYRGTIDEQTRIGLQVWVSDRRSSAWARRQHALWRESLGRGKETVRLIVISKESGYWWIDARVESISEVNFFDQQPGALGEVGELVTLVADRSFWQRFDETRIFDRDTAPNAQLTNLGDQPAWLRYAIYGDHQGVEIGVGSDIVKLPDPRTLNLKEPVEGYYIDTETLWPALMSTDGLNLQTLFPDAFWKEPLPPRGVQRDNRTPITIKPTNPGANFRVEVNYTPRTEQPW